MGYLCATCGGVGGLFKTSHAHSDKDSCIVELRAKLDATMEREAHFIAEKASLVLQIRDLRAGCDAMRQALQGFFLQHDPRLPQYERISLALDKMMAGLDGVEKRKCGLTKPLGNGETCALEVGHIGPCDHALKRVEPSQKCSNCGEAKEDVLPYCRDCYLED